MNFAKNLTREYKGTFSTLDITNKLNLLDNDTELYSAGTITSVSFYGDFARFKNLSCRNASFEYVEFDELYAGKSSLDMIDVIDASIVSCSITTLHNVSFDLTCASVTSLSTTLDDTNSSLINLSTAFYNISTLNLSETLMELVRHVLQHKHTKP
jgi:hypothetical protein